MSLTNRFKIKKMLLWAIAWATVTLVLLMVFVSFFLTEYTFMSADIQGGNEFSDEELLTLAGLQFPVKYISVDSKHIVKRLVAHPHIERAQIRKRFNSVLQITIVYGSPLVYVRDTSTNQIHYFDSVGRHIHKSDIITTRSKLPIVELRGLMFKDLELGYVLPKQHQWYLAQLGAIQHDPSFQKIHALEVELSSNNNAQVKLSFHDFSVPFLLEQIDQEVIAKITRFARTVSMYNVNSTIEYFDIRSGFIIGKTYNSTQERL